MVILHVLIHVDHRSDSSLFLVDIRQNSGRLTSEYWSTSFRTLVDLRRNLQTIFQRADMIAEAIYIVRAPIEALALTPSEWAIKQKKLKGFAKEGIEVK